MVCYCKRAKSGLRGGMPRTRADRGVGSRRSSFRESDGAAGGRGEGAGRAQGRRTRLRFSGPFKKTGD
jgi:hypothetical protein